MTDVASKVNNILGEYLKGNKKRAYLQLKKISKEYPLNEKLKFNLAFIEQDQGNIEEAKKSYLDLINKFDNFNSKLNLYNIFLKEKNYLRSLELIEDVLKIKNDLIDVWIDKAYINYKIKDYKLSKDICYSILSKIKNNTKSLNLIGLCLFKEKNYDESLNYLFQGLKVDEKDLSLLNSIGEVYYELRNLNKSEKYYLKALRIKPDSYQTLNNIAGFYLETNNSEKALLFYERALKFFPNESTVLGNISKTYFSLNQNKLAKKFSTKSLSIRSSASVHKLLSNIYLKEENFIKAWEHFDGRLNEDNFIYRNDSFDLIKDKLLHKRKIDPKKQLLIIREQGVGDEILYATMYKDVLENFSNTYIEADERLIDLFINSFGKQHANKLKKFGFFSKNENNLKNIDQVLYAGSLGYYFRNQLNDFPKKGYAKIDQTLIEKTKKDLVSFDKKFKVGISWKSLNNKYAEQKSLSLENLLDLLRLPDIDFFNLQYGDVLKEIQDFNDSYNLKLINLKNIDLFNDFLKVASVLKNLDLFITVSNSTAHLAGALGVKTLLIKPFNQATFFYWNQNTNRTPWYPDIELIDTNLIDNKKLLIELVYSKLK
jgi:tetratricopeptide (TPR) repeat protein